MYSSWSVRNSLSSCSMYIFEHCPLPPMSTSHPLTWWMLPDLPCFLPSFRSQVLLQMQTESKSGVGLGTRLLTTYCKFVTSTNSSYPWMKHFHCQTSYHGWSSTVETVYCEVHVWKNKACMPSLPCPWHVCGMHARGLAANSWIFFNKL